MSPLSQARLLAYLPSSHSAFQGHAAHLVEWSTRLRPKGSWGLGRPRARCLTARLPLPPVRPVREPFASYGSRPRTIMGRGHCASSTGPSPWTALRVRWIPVYGFPTLSLRACALYVAFLRSDYSALVDCLQGLGVSLGSRLPPLPPPAHPFQALPCAQPRTQTQHAVGGVLLLAPSTLWGFPAPPGGRAGFPMAAPAV